MNIADILFALDWIAQKGVVRTAFPQFEVAKHQGVTAPGWVEEPVMDRYKVAVDLIYLKEAGLVKIVYPEDKETHLAAMLTPGGVLMLELHNKAQDCNMNGWEKVLIAVHKDRKKRMR